MPSFWARIIVLTALVMTAAKSTTVTTSNGTVQGGRCSSTDSNFFLGIPFADPPVGALRYQTPQPFSGSYNGTLNGLDFAPICYQFGTANILSGKQSEDCLYLNVYAPANATSSSSLPVKVWIYGGAFEIGGSSDPLYNACFSSTDAVVVTVNYRLGPLGYLALENTTLSGNYGAQDQLQAVRWVHDNIAAFGGNPDQVLLFGQSAGAISSFVLATLPEITSLVNAVVMESGGGFDLPTISTAQAFHLEFVKGLHCDVTDVDCVRSRTPAQLNATYIRVHTSYLSFAYTPHDQSGAMFPWGPLAETHMFPMQPSQVGVKVPAIFGSNGKEGSTLALPTFDALGVPVSSLNETEYMDFLTANFGSLASKISQQYPLSSFDNAFDAISIIEADYTFRCPAYRGASLAAVQGLPVWTYSFNQTLTCPWVEGQSRDTLALLGAGHTTEIPFVWGEVSNLPPTSPLHPASPATGNCSLSSGERDISAYMQSSWTNMASGATPGNGWPTFSPNSTQGVNFQGGEIIPGTVDYSMCTFWDKIDSALLEMATAAANNASGTDLDGAASSTASSVAPSTGGAGKKSVTMFYPAWATVLSMLITVFNS